jgi:hypothetical protein
MTRVAALLCTCAILAAPPCARAEGGPTALEEFVQILKGAALTRPCPMPISAVVARRPGSYVLSFTLTNATKRSLKIHSKSLPWSARGAMSLVGILPDGSQVTFVPATADVYPPHFVVLAAGATLKGDVPLAWGSGDVAAPPGANMLVLWAFPYQLQAYPKKTRPTCSGVAVVPSDSDADLPG